MKKQSISRAAAVLSASALTLGLSATTATAAQTPTPRPAASTFASPNTGVGSASGTGVGVATGVGKDRTHKIERLRKALARARAERADAYDTARAARTVASDTTNLTNDSQTVLTDATETVRLAKVDLRQSRILHDAARVTLANATDLLTRNHEDQSAATAAIGLAEDIRDNAITTAADLTAALPGLRDAIPTADTAVSDAEAEIATLTGTTIPQATTDRDDAYTTLSDLETQTSDALQTYTNQTYAYNGGCEPLPDDTVGCIDNTGVYAIRSEVTDMWRTYLSLRGQRDAAQVVADDADAALTAAQDDLTYWTAEHATRVTAAADARTAVTTAETGVTNAQSAQVAAEATIVEQTTLLDTLVVAAGPLAANLTVADAGEKAAATVHDQSAATFNAATNALNHATDVHEDNLDNQERAQQSLEQSARALAAAQDRARFLKDRLDKARAQR